MGNNPLIAAAIIIYYATHSNRNNSKRQLVDTFVSTLKRMSALERLYNLVEEGAFEMRFVCHSELLPER